MTTKHYGHVLVFGIVLALICARYLRMLKARRARIAFESHRRFFQMGMQLQIAHLVSDSGGSMSISELI